MIKESKNVSDPEIPDIGKSEDSFINNKSINKLDKSDNNLNVSKSSNNDV